VESSSSFFSWSVGRYGYTAVVMFVVVEKCGGSEALGACGDPRILPGGVHF
jgi:hypothetical protein